MKLTFLGTGSAATVGADNYHSNMLLEDAAKQRLLIDCGSDIRFSLLERGLSYKDIAAVYISHLHADHVGGLEWLALCTQFDPECGKPTLYITDTLVHDVWHKVLEGGLSTLQGTVANLASYFNVVALPQNGVFKWKDANLQLVQTVHVMNGFSLMPSYGLFITVKKQTIFLTTDTQLAPNQIKTFYQQADIIFHDCETTATKSGVHAHYTELSTLEPQYKAKMWLYHYSPGELPDAQQAGFKGFVQKGQCFDLG